MVWAAIKIMKWVLEIRSEPKKRSFSVLLNYLNLKFIQSATWWQVVFLLQSLTVVKSLSGVLVISERLKLLKQCA